MPYGEERWTDGATPTDFGFTSQRNEAGFGLYDYNARYYSPYLNRFISPDTVVPDPQNPQNFNRYSYVLGNPLKSIDPSGHQGCSVFDGACPDFWKPLREMWKSAPDVAPEVAEDMAVNGAESVVKSGEFVVNAVTPPSPDAISFGFSASADLGVPGGSFSINVGGEDIINFNTGEHTVFGYHGPGVSLGASANVSAYIGLVWNLPENKAYLGSFESVNATVAAGHGGSFTYFWAPGDEPVVGAFTSGNTKGFSVGYAPGAGASVSYNQTEYSIFKSYPPSPPEEQQKLDCTKGDC